MSITVNDLLSCIENHRCYSHPIFHHWGKLNPDATVVGALFHQIQSFCASTRPGGNYLDAMKMHGLVKENHFQKAIVESEENHGPELATMAGYILNKAANKEICADLYDQESIENTLKIFSNQLLSQQPDYDEINGLALQTRNAIAVLNRREATDYETTIKNIGTTLALEKISNRQLIPGEKHCLLDCHLYNVTINDPEMHYLLEHYGEIGAEQQHEKYAMDMVESVLNDKTAPLLLEGINDFLNSVANLWDLLDISLLKANATNLQASVA